MRILSLGFCLLLLLSISSCTPLQKIAYLPTILNENSGLLIQGDKILLHNDSGDDPKLYVFSPETKALHEIYLLNAKNVDWEDLATDQKGNIYIGDFGNNRNQRKDLCIYKLKAPYSLDADSLSALKIEFHYPDQKAFPPKPHSRHFDLEAMIAFGDSLYLFTKNRTKPNDGYIKLYRLPQEAGNYTAVLQDSFKIKRGRFRKSVTSAAISKDGTQLALLSMGKLRIFKDFEGTDFFNARIQKTYPIHFTQKEAIDFKNDNLLYISDEKSPLGKARIYKLRLKSSKLDKK
jgi:hypothetical protein